MAEQRLAAFFKFILGEDSEGYLALASRHAATESFVEAFLSYPEDIDRAVRRVDTWKPISNVWFCPTILRSDQRIKDNVDTSQVAWADLDECEPSNLLVTPTLVLETSPGRWQAYWKFKSTQAALDVEDLNRRIAYYHADQGCDKSGWDLTQLLRVPTTWNHKYRAEQGLITVDVSEANTDLLYDMSDFNEYPQVEGIDYRTAELPTAMPVGSGNDILDTWKSSLNPRAWSLVSETPIEDWSKSLWQLEQLLFEVGLSDEEVFVVCRDAACNKYSRDRGDGVQADTLLWKDVARARDFHSRNANTISVVSSNGITHEDVEFDLDMPPLLTQEERDQCASQRSFVEEYIDWAKGIGDAAPQYHMAGAFVILSAVCSGTVRLPTSFGTVTPNLWFMILADTTLTRKTTAMDMAMDILTEVDEDCVLATDGSIEGLLTSLSTRPGRPSIFLRDEFSGLLEMLTKRDYYAGMLEALTKLYDGKMQKRVLRKETIEVRDPVVILFTGGIREKILQLLDAEHINSGFIPRFIFLTAISDITKLRPIGPPSRQDNEHKDEIIRKVRTMWEYYNAKQEREAGSGSGRTVQVSPRWDATLTDDAWVRYNKFEASMVNTALESAQPDLLVPVMDRLAKSGLKAAVLMAAGRMDGRVEVSEADLVRAFWYVERWREYTLEVIHNVGKSADERIMERIYNAIERQPGIGRSTIMQNFRLTASRADAIFATLSQRGLIKQQTNKGKGTKLHAVIDA